MKTASIITMHYPNNFGAVLQTYALKSYLESQGASVNIIDYRPEYMVKKLRYTYVPQGRFSSNCVLKLLYIAAKFPVRYKQHKEFDAFRKKELNFTTTYSSYQKLRNNPPKADVYICGSDQIWNANNETIDDPAYFLQFGDAKKVAYAASGTLPNEIEIESKIRPRLESFTGIGLRESHMVNTLSKYSQLSVQHVCDPVFLLKPEEWRKLYMKSKNLQINEDYILVYAIGESEDCINKAKCLSKRYQLPIYTISFSQKKVDENVRTLRCSPYDFLCLFDNASYIISNSFHGTAFSIIFQKQFVSCKTEIANHRIESLLAKVNLSSCFLEPNDIIRDDYYVDFEDNSLLSNYINDSYSFIQKYTL